MAFLGLFQMKFRSNLFKLPVKTIQELNAGRMMNKNKS